MNIKHCNCYFYNEYNRGLRGETSGFTKRTYVHQTHVRFALPSLKYTRERQSVSKYLRQYLLAAYENFKFHKSQVMEQM